MGSLNSAGFRMVEELWHHALGILEQYRTGQLIDPTEQLYQFEDQTGILDTHREWLAGRQVDMKIMFYELICMITGHERADCEDSGMYDLARSVGKIEGYQELTNKMQRVFNVRLNLDIDEIDKKQSESDDKIEALEKKFDVINDRFNLEKYEMNQKQIESNQMIKALENGFDNISEQNKILSKSCSALENAKKLLEFEVGSLEKKLSNIQIDQRSVGEVDLLFHELNTQNDPIEKLSDKVNKVTNNSNILTLNDKNNTEIMDNLEGKGMEFEEKLTKLESADLYLQRSQKMLIERTDIVEKHSRYLKMKVNSLNNQKEEKEEEANYNLNGNRQERRIEEETNLNIERGKDDEKKNLPNEKVFKFF